MVHLSIQQKYYDITDETFDFCHIRIQLTISHHHILIQDDQLWPHSGIIFTKEPAGWPTIRLTTVIVVQYERVEFSLGV